MYLPVTAHDQIFQIMAKSSNLLDKSTGYTEITFITEALVKMGQEKRCSTTGLTFTIQ